MGKRKFLYVDVKRYIGELGYRLNEVKYVDSQSEMSITCPSNHTYKTSFSEFKRRKYRGCSECNPKKKLTHYHVEKIMNRYGFMIISGMYHNSNSELIVECPNKHSYPTNYNKFKIGMDRGTSICPICFNQFKRGKFRKHSYEYVENYITSEGFELLTEESKYNNVNSKIELLCKEKHLIETTFDKFHNFDIRCAKCYGNARKTQKEFKKEVYNLVGDEYKLVSNYTNAHNKVLFLHSICGEVFPMSPNSFVSKKSRCTKCGQISKGENKIITHLKSRGVTYTKGKRFAECRNKNTLPFDICVGNNDILIEYDGVQHFKSIEYFGGQKGFNNVIQNDNIKNKYCINNNIPLVRIPYWEFSNIDKILESLFGYFKLIDKNEINESLVHKFLVNHPYWSHEEYIKQGNIS